MGLFNKLKKLFSGVADQAESNETQNEVSNTTNEIPVLKIDYKLEMKKKNEEYFQKIQREQDAKYYNKILLNFDYENFLRTGKLQEDEQIELDKFKLDMKEFDEMEERKKKEREVVNEKIKLKEKQQREKVKNALIKKYGEENGKKIYKKELFVGMTLEMLKEVKGKHAEKVQNVINGKEKIKLYYEKSKNRLGNISYGFEVSLEEGLVVGWKDRKNKATREDD